MNLGGNDDIERQHDDNEGEGIESDQEDDHLDEHSQDPVVVFFEQALQSLPPSSSRCCIYRVPERLRILNARSYTPRVVSIGPFHFKAPHLEAMIQYKLRYMEAFLRCNDIILADYVEYVRAREQDIRDCYAETIELSSNELVQMILMDGCFIVELLLRKRFGEYIDVSDRLFRKPFMISAGVIDDLILLENQIPFFVLEWIFNQVRDDYPDNLSIIDLIHNLFKPFVNMDEYPIDSLIEHDINHIADFTRRYYFPKSQGKRHKAGIAINEITVPPSATELHEAGVKFAKSTSTSSLVDVKFTNGCLEIPHFVVEDWTETSFRNLIAFGQCHDTDKYITHFMFLMDCFINTAKDVDLLVQNGVISCALGDSKDVSKLFNSLCKEVTLGHISYYFDLCKTINAYCKTPWNKWKATLKRDYFKTPWAIASTIAAVVLLILTFMQAVCSILQLT